MRLSTRKTIRDKEVKLSGNNIPWIVYQIASESGSNRRRDNRPIVVATRLSVIPHNLLMTRDPRGEVSAA